jgi:hypothetical protein
VAALMDVPLRGGANWTAMYAPRTSAFLPAVALWRAAADTRRVRSNLGVLKGATTNVFELLSPNDAAGLRRNRRRRYRRMLVVAERALAVAEGNKGAGPDASLTPEELAALDPGERQQTTGCCNPCAPSPRPWSRRAGCSAASKNSASQLRDRLGGRMLVFGWASVRGGGPTPWRRACTPSAPACSSTARLPRDPRRRALDARPRAGRRRC